LPGAFERLHSSPASTPTARADRFAVPADPQQRLNLHRQLSTSTAPLSPQQQRWLASYAKSHEYKVLHQKTA
jgi:putative transposase